MANNNNNKHVQHYFWKSPMYLFWCSIACALLLISGPSELNVAWRGVIGGERARWTYLTQKYKIKISEENMAILWSGWPKGLTPQNGNIPFENLLPPRKLLLLDTCATLKLTTRKDWSLVKFNWISLFPSCRCSASAMIQLCAGDGWWSNSTTAGRRSARCAARCFARLVTHCLSYDTVPVPTVH